MKTNIPHQFIAVEGNIGAGKTTLCQRLAADWDCRLILEQFTNNPFLPYFYKNPERYAFPVELFFMTERHKQLQEQLQQRDLFSDAILADYYFYKTLLFARNTLNEEEYRLFERLFHILNAKTRRPDLLVYLHRPVESLLKNIRKRGRNIESDISGDYLSKIQGAYFDYFKNQRDLPVLVVDLDHADFESDEQHYRAVTRLLQRSYSPGMHIKKLSEDEN